MEKNIPSLPKVRRIVIIDIERLKYLKELQEKFKLSEDRLVEILRSITDKEVLLNSAQSEEVKEILQGLHKEAAGEILEYIQKGLLMNPEDVAKLQALYSRSAASVLEHIEKVKKDGSSKFMEQWYVEYGHGSIGDGASVTIFIENVSILAAKAIQDSPLYCGQETSTRYINMEEQPFVNPLQSYQGEQIHDAWMKFYIEAMEETQEHLKTVYPLQDGEEEKSYNKAIKARAFDSLRAFLPAGKCTQLSWHTSLRHAAERLAVLRHHPLLEVRQIAEEIHTQLKENYPASFSHKIYPEQEAYNAKMAQLYTYYHNPECPEYSFRTNVEPTELEPYKEAFAGRPKKTNLPYFLKGLGDCTCDFLLDYGSSRDAQRHRHGVFRMPLLTTDLGFHDWYLNELSPASRERALILIESQLKHLKELSASPEVLQYYIPLGFLVSCQTTYSLPQMAYVIDLRTDKTVHPTYREVAQKMATSIRETFPAITLHDDTEKSNWDVRRGKQDIVKKPVVDNSTTA